MARRGRLFIPGLTHHVVHRGVNRAAVFLSSADHALYIRILTRAAAAARVAIHAYALMSNHIHLMATPESERGLSLMMQEVGRIYVPFFNRRYGRTGTLWDGRFRPAVVQTEMYWMTCLRYVELNPVRAGIVARPEDYRWSSYRAHAFGTRDSLLTSHPLFDGLGTTATQRGEAWRTMCDAPLPDEKLVELRYLLATNQVDEPTFSEVQEA
jgi:putative transposase